ncbi:MAG TPA: APC family permease [Terriglobales bacterium]|nr:APC family permease [Terriglobales bacterium]
MTSPPPTQLVRAIGRWSLAALVLNSIIGSSIFGLPSIIAGLLGRASPLAYLLTALGMVALMGCFAEVASQFDAAGGPYLYARSAFGRPVGILMGWLLWLARVTAPAAATNLFVNYLGEFWSGAQAPAGRLAVLTLLIGVLAVVNYRGVSAGAWLSNVSTVAKIATLVAFIAVGGVWLATHSPSGPPPPPVHASWHDWVQAVLLLVFAYGGFESALTPMGEAKDPQRDAPFALFSVLLVVTILYTLVQTVVVYALPNAAQTERPLAAAARLFLGGPGAVLVTAGALVSLYGYLSAMMLAGPRIPFAMAENRDLPTVFAAIHPRFRTPNVSIVLWASLMWGLAVYGTFRWNVALSSAARLFYYGLTCAALVVLRRKQPEAARFRLLAGTLMAALGIAFSLVLVSGIGKTEVVILATTTVIALLNLLWVRLRAQPQSPA